MRLLRVIKKEYKEFVRDKGYILTMVLVPLILMLVFGYAFQSNITDLNTIIIDEDHSEYSAKIVDAVHDSEYFQHIEFLGSLEDAKETLGKINELKNEEDAELELWHSGLEEVERKVAFVDKVLFEPSTL